MKQPRNAACPRAIAVATAATLLIGGGLYVGSTASAEGATTVTGVTGRAIGYSSSVGLFGGPAKARGLAETTGCDATTTTSCSPSVNLPATGGSELATDADGAVASYGPADLVEAASLNASTEGTTGDAGRVTASASATVVGPGPLSAAKIGSTCTADAAGVTASTAIAGGQLVTRTNATTGEPSVTRAIGPAPAPNTVVIGTIDHVGDSFKAVFNEQILNPDGSITVNAYHEYLLGPIAVGDLIVGQSTCGVTSAARADRPQASGASAPPGEDEAAAPGDQAGTPLPAALSKAALNKGAAAAPAGPAPLAAAAATPLVLPAGTEGAGAYGFYASVGLFGGPATPNGPTPKVALPAGGADPAVTAADPTGKAQYGPAAIYESGEMKVSTQGTATSSTSSASAADVGPTQVQAKLASSTCSSTNGDLKGSATFTGGTVRVSLGPDKDATENDDVIVPIPENPAPNTSFDGVIENVGDRFKVIVNEQEVTGNGIIVNAVHLKLLGDIAVGDVIIAQSRCLKSGSTPAANSGNTENTGNTGASGGTTRASGNRSTTGGGTPMASTGVDPPVIPGVTLVALGSALVLWGRSRRRARPEPQANGHD